MHSKVLLAVSAVLGLTSASVLPTKTTNGGISLRLARVRRDPNATVNPPLAVDTINDNDGIGAGSDTYKPYSGDGSTGAGWPSMSQWVSFGDMFNNNMHNFFTGCEHWQVADDTADEVASLRSAIEQIAQQSRLDHRVILAVILNESTGCVRVPTSIAPGTTIFNPGLMQDHQGSHSCNFGSDPNNPVAPGQTGVLAPCPEATIVGMVQDGAQGTASGDGVASLVNLALSQGISGAQAFYLAAGYYNGGTSSVTPGGPLKDYSVKLANRLTGWLQDGN